MFRRFLVRFFNMQQEVYDAYEHGWRDGAASASDERMFRAGYKAGYNEAVRIRIEETKND